MIVSIIVSFVIAMIAKLFYLFLQMKREGKKIRFRQVIVEMIGGTSIVGVGYILRKAWDWLASMHLVDGSFILLVVIPAILWLLYQNNPDFFKKREKQAMFVLCHVLILIFITPILGS